MAMNPRRKTLYATLLQLVLQGELAPGARANASELARTLGVSRTPVHEALLQLAAEGFVRQELHRGFVVMPLQRNEVQQRYPIIGALEALALRSSGTLLTTTLKELRMINDQLSATVSQPEEARRCDQQFHQLLASRCDNARLLSILATEHRAIERYERLYMQQANLIMQSIAQHAEIIIALEEGDIEQAVRALEWNWRFGMDRVLLQLRSI